MFFFVRFLQGPPSHHVVLDGANVVLRRRSGRLGEVGDVRVGEVVRHGGRTHFSSGHDRPVSDEIEATPVDAERAWRQSLGTVRMCFCGEGRQHSFSSRNSPN